MASSITDGASRNARMTHSCVCDAYGCTPAGCTPAGCNRCWWYGDDDNAGWVWLVWVIFIFVVLSLFCLWPWWCWRGDREACAPKYDVVDKKGFVRPQLRV